MVLTWPRNCGLIEKKGQAMPEVSSHPLSPYPEGAKVAYLSLLAGLCFANKEFGEKERQQLEAQLQALRISAEDRGRVYSAVHGFRDDHAEIVADDLLKLKGCDLRFTLVSDLYAIALADSIMTHEEESCINELAGRIGIGMEQCATIRNVQSAIKLAASSVPVAAITASGSVFGFAAPCLTFDLTALGPLVSTGMLNKPRREKRVTPPLSVARAEIHTPEEKIFLGQLWDVSRTGASIFLGQNSFKGTSKNTVAPWGHRLRLMSWPVPGLAMIAAKPIFRGALKMVKGDNVLLRIRSRLSPQIVERESTVLCIDIEHGATFVELDFLNQLEKGIFLDSFLDAEGEDV
jgi:uncharacterized tellurite resistance protein B-like protein